MIPFYIDEIICFLSYHFLEKSQGKTMGCSKEKNKIKEWRCLKPITENFPDILIQYDEEKKMINFKILKRNDSDYKYLELNGVTYEISQDFEVLLPLCSFEIGLKKKNGSDFRNFR